MCYFGHKVKTIPLLNILVFYQYKRLERGLRDEFHEGTDVTFEMLLVAKKCLWTSAFHVVGTLVLDIDATFMVFGLPS